MSAPAVDPLAELAEAAGLATAWTDVFEKTHAVSPETLRAVLAALELPAASPAQIRESRARLRAQAADGLPLLTTVAGAPLALDMPEGTRVRFRLEAGGVRDATCQEGRLPGLTEPGYHIAELPGRELTIAVAPPRAVTLAERAGGRRIWGVAAQLYALRRTGDVGVGDFTALGDLAAAVARRGAQAVAVSPVHALFAADPHRFSPYAPSSRLLLNWLHVDAGGPAPPPAAAAADGLVDWPSVARARRAALHTRWRQRDAATERDFIAFREAAGETLEHHAVFEALQADLLTRDPGQWHWRHWPAAYRDPGSPAVARFAAEHAEEVGFHAFAQFLADRGLAEAQARARAAGMAIGLISDLAVGTDSSGSHCWSRQQETLNGLSIGAPPDLLAPQGQDWGVTAFSPRGLALCGFRAFIEMLRAALRHAGGVRIDHAMGLARLWVLPAGASATEGTYLRFPRQDLMRLVALESHRHQAVVLGEDLGTVPEGFSDQMVEAGMAGLRVLFFERVFDWFRPPAQWTPGAAAMTSTHDLATVAGWWEGRDLDLRARLGLLRDEAQDRADRARDRGLLWAAFRESGAARDEAPAANEGHHAAGSAVVHVGKTACALALIPLEDVLALRDQPNLPGTTTEYPNWRRRLPGPAEEILGEPAAAARLTALAEARTETP